MCAVPSALYKSEQTDISRRLVEIEERLEAQHASFEIIEHRFSMLLELVQHIHIAYQRAEVQVRRWMNQSFFAQVFVDDEGVDAVVAEPFNTLFAAAHRPSVLSGTTRRNNLRRGNGRRL